MKKNIIYIVLLILPFFLSGCAVNYDLEFKNNDIIEKVSIKEDDSIVLNDDTNRDVTNMELCEKTSKYYYPSIPGNIPNDDLTTKLKGEKYYSTSHNVTDNLCELNYEYSYNVNNYSKSYAVNSYLKYFKFVEEDKFYTLSTGNEIYAFDEFEDLDSIKVHISSNHKVKSNNADTSDGYDYYWTINKGEPKYIQISFYKNKYILDYKGSLKRTLYIVGGIVGSILLIALILYSKYKKTGRV